MVKICDLANARTIIPPNFVKVIPDSTCKHKYFQNEYIIYNMCYFLISLISIQISNRGLLTELPIFISVSFALAILFSPTLPAKARVI